MKFSILIPHYKVGPMVAYTVAQILKYKGDHEVDIVVIDNNPGDGSIEYLDPFLKDITIVEYPKGKLQSHGIAFDYVLPEVRTSHFITLESDSYPTREGFLDYYENVIEGGFSMAGSLLTLSGGSYIHPCGSVYSRELWDECNEYCKSIPYAYFSAMLMRDNFSMHTMIHKDYLDQVLENPEEWFELAAAYKPYSKKTALDKLTHYSPTCGVFHNGMGGRQENIKTFGGRTWESDVPFIIYTPKWQKIIGRIGYEPGQFLHYYAASQKKKIFEIKTEVKWLPGKEFQQQEYTINEAGVLHIWAGSSFLDMKGTSQNDVYEIKKKTIDELYETLPPNQRIK